MLIVGDGSSPTAVRETSEGNPPHQLPAAPTLSQTHPRFAAWDLSNLNRPKLLFSSKSSGRQPPTEVPVPQSCAHAWRSCMSPEGDFAAILEPAGGWHFLSASEAGQLSEVQLPPPEVGDGSDSAAATGSPVVTSIAWDDVSCVLAVWSDRKLTRVSLNSSSQGAVEVAATGVTIASGAVVAKAAGGQEDAEGPLGELPDDPAPLVVVEPEWEDGSAVEQVGSRVRIAMLFFTSPSSACGTCSSFSAC